MGEYRIAEICKNGHVTTACADQYPEFREKYCSKCGEETLMQCPDCNTPIRGYYDIPGRVSFSDYSIPAYCYNCGKAYPWTINKLEAVLELVGIGGELSDSELTVFKNDLGELIKDSPKVQVASVRFKCFMKKVGITVGEGVKEILVGIVSEAARKAIWGE